MEPLIAPVLDFVCPSSWVSNPEWISCLHSFLLVDTLLSNMKINTINN